jgi:long-chain acyl-CoA synthetase
VTAAPFSLAGIVGQHARERGEQAALLFGERAVSWRALDEAAGRVAHGLLAAGVTAGSRIAFLDKNGPEYFEVLFGGAKVNAVNVAVNWRLGPPEMAYVVNDAEARVLFVGETFLPQLAAFQPELRTVRHIVVIGEDGATRHARYAGWRDSQAIPARGAPPAPDDVAMQLYTSGTTGRPKGAMITNANLGCLIPHTTARWGMTADSVNLVAMPLFHIGGSGWALVGMYNGCRSVLLREAHPAEILAALPRHRVTHAFLVPALLQFLLATPGCERTDFSALRLMVYGASPIADDVLVRALATFRCRFMQVYGMTETTGAVTELAPEEHDPAGPGASRLRSCGRPYPWVEARIVDIDTGQDVPPGRVGELWTRSPQNMKGYWNLPEETARTITPEGWLRTGDLAYRDAEGFVYLYDRLKDMIITGGENVYPAEVENVLMSHPGLADVAVIGVPDVKWGETVKALVVRAPGATLSEVELIDWARERLAHFKCPTSVDFATSLPRNPSGKLLKKELREPYWRDRDRRIS